VLKKIKKDKLFFKQSAAIQKTKDEIIEKIKYYTNNKGGIPP